jgi:hypothetical protein
MAEMIVFGDFGDGFTLLIEVGLHKRLKLVEFTCILLNSLIARP